MTKKDLVKIIQEAVRREVKKEVRKIFIEEQPGKLISTKEVIETPQVNSKKVTSPFSKSSINLSASSMPNFNSSLIILKFLFFPWIAFCLSKLVKLNSVFV